MSVTNVTREELWAKQHLSCKNMDYAVWERDKSMLQKLSRINGGCSFVVDVYKGCYAYASTGFVDWLGYDRHKIETLEKQGDYLESRIHPHDRSQLEDLQVRLGKFIYNQPFEHRNDYCNVYSFRILNARGNYVRVTSRHQVLEQSHDGKAWLIIGNMSMAPGQKESEQVECTVLNLRNGEMFSPGVVIMNPAFGLTGREMEILRLIQRGFLSKEIADKLCISIHTVHIHRQNLLRKLGVQNSLEAIRLGQASGLFS